ncbi:MAG: thermonuclease family protein [Rhodospirillaceae bacterium]|nr:thermonuclease family protein [Rhodospirillaceae bacterium]
MIWAERRSWFHHVATGAACLALVAAMSQGAVARPQPQPVNSGTVKAIVDGDTVVLRSGVEIRLVGIQAPKLPLGRRGFQAWPLASESKEALARLTLGKTLTLSYGGRKIDRHGRLLAHLATKDGRWVQGALLSAGMARVYTFPDNRGRAAEMLAQERAARGARRGIWNLRYYRILKPEEAGRFIGTFQLIEGKILQAALVRGRAYLNFGANWKTDFTITMSPKSRRRHWRGEKPVQDYEGRRVRVRGWLKSFNGPMIEATHPEQIEVLP